MLTVGIDKIGFYTPNYYIDLKELAIYRGYAPEKLINGLGQHRMSVILPDEDIVTMAYAASDSILTQADKEDIGLLLFATETGIDQSKAAGIYVHKYLALSPLCRVLELKQACYSGVGGLQLALAWLEKNPHMKVLLICADVARYGLGAKGESSQGAGAVALLLSVNPRILAFDNTFAVYADEVMDFWRPNYTTEAIVDGKYSCEIYLDFLQKVWQLYTMETGRTLADLAQICYHAAIPKLVEKAHNNLAKGKINADIKATLKLAQEVGNCYTASLYMAFLSLLYSCTVQAGDRIGFYSYGSGSIAEFFSGVIVKDYNNLLLINNIDNMLNQRHKLSISAYEEYYNLYANITGNTKVARYSNAKLRFTGTTQHQRIYELENSKATTTLEVCDVYGKASE